MARPSVSGLVLTSVRYNPVMARNVSLVRSVQLVRDPAVNGVGIMCLTDRKGESFYAFHEIPCEIGGRGFCVHRIGMEQLYHVRIHGAVESTCECMGYLSHGRCRHIFALQALLQEGRLVVSH